MHHTLFLGASTKMRRCSCRKEGAGRGLSQPRSVPTWNIIFQAWGRVKRGTSAPINILSRDKKVRIIGSVGSLAVCFLHKINPNPRKKEKCWGKKVPGSPNATFNLFFLGLAWPSDGKLVGFIIIVNTFFNRIWSREHPKDVSCEQFWFFAA